MIFIEANAIYDLIWLIVILKVFEMLRQSMRQFKVVQLVNLLYVYLYIIFIFNLNQTYFT